MDLAKAILWIVLLAVFIWLAIELVFFIRKVRKRVDGVMDSLEKTVDTANKTLEDLNPAVQEIQPLLAKTETAIDALSLDLLHANEILGNVNTVTGAASKATNAVSGVVERAGDAVSGVVGKITGKTRKHKEKKLVEAAEKDNPVLEGEVEEAVADEGYFTYAEDDGSSKKSNGNAEND